MGGKEMFSEDQVQGQTRDNNNCVCVESSACILLFFRIISSSHHSSLSVVDSGSDGRLAPQCSCHLSQEVGVYSSEMTCCNVDSSGGI
jgi:hypothetical protein